MRKDINIYCRICNSSSLNEFTVKEMLFGSREEFVYQECNRCKSIQIKEIPNDLSKYYPQNYHAYKKQTLTNNYSLKNYFKKYMARNYLLNKSTILSRILIRSFGLGLVKNLKYCNCDLDSRILDVGCGNGARILGLSTYGFNNLTGIEPFYKVDSNHDKVNIYHDDISNHKGKYDLIMFNHVYEHVISPQETLEHVERLLSKNGRVLIAIPVADSYAWKEFGSCWVALDAPRHLHIFSALGLSIVAEKMGFEIYDKVYESNEYQFWGSIQFKNDIATRDKNSYHENPDLSMFSKKEIDNFRVRAKELNEKETGDIAAFFLKRKCE
jgi:2-polyprenyl-3-methyl-5-hydroxy-6-metoxy-1,4-benzoquinol methylase